MKLSSLKRSNMFSRLAPLFGAAALLACQERLAAPADCPNLCPGGYSLVDTIINPLADQDSSFEGYLLAGQGQSLRVSYQFPASEDRAVVRFVARPDSYTVSTDSFLPYTLDSVSLAVSVDYRDTTVKDLYLYLYRLPATLDSSFTFAQAEAAFTPANIIDSLHVDDTLRTARVSTILKDSTLARVLIPPEDSGVLAIGVQIRAAQGTGVRLGASGSVAPTFISWGTVQITDTTTLIATFNRFPEFETYVSQSVPPLDPSVLTVGGAPSARSFIRFGWPDYLRDSVQILRSTLELVPTAPFPGLFGDTAFLQVRPLLADFGGKSPVASDGFYLGIAPILLGASDTVQVEVRRATTLWQGSSARPPALMLQLFPEASSFSRAVFGSTRTPGFAPRLRITYVHTFPFEAP
jgi:hypothetical protein